MPTKMNDREIDSMFDDIGKAKENMAKGIVEQQKKEAEEARKHRPFGGGEELYGDDVDLDAMEREVDEELRIIRQGVPIQPAESTDEAKAAEESLVESDFVLEIKSEEPEKKSLTDDLPEPMIDTTSPNSPLAEENRFNDASLIAQAVTAAPSVALPDPAVKSAPVENAVAKAVAEDILESEYVLDMSQGEEVPVANDEKAAEEDVNPPAESVTEADIPVSEEEVQTENKEGEVVLPSPEVADVLQPDIVKARLSVSAEDKAGFHYIFSVETSKGAKSVCAETLKATDWEEAVFMSANKLIDAVTSLEDQTVVLATSESIADLLRRNAAYGIVDTYSEACASYIEKVRALAAKKSLRVNASNETDTDVWQLLEAAF